METSNYTFEYDNREVCPCESLPEILKPIKDFKALCDEYGVELEKLYSKVSQLLDDQFISTASEETIAKFEKRLNIIPKATDTLPERRFRILAILNDRPPYTDKYLRNKLDELCGKTNWRSFEDYSNYTLTIELSDNSLSNTETITKLVKNIVPANIKLTVQDYYTRYGNLNRWYHYKLSDYTHEQIEHAEILRQQE